MAQIKASHPQVLISWTVGSPFSTVLRGFHDSGLDIPLVTNGANMTIAQIQQLASIAPKELHFLTIPAAIKGSAVLPQIAKVAARLLHALRAERAQARRRLRERLRHDDPRHRTRCGIVPADPTAAQMQRLLRAPARLGRARTRSTTSVSASADRAKTASSSRASTRARATSNRSANPAARRSGFTFRESRARPER